LNEEELGKLIARRHPEYNSRVNHWNFLEACYEGGRDWFKDNVFRYIKEGDTEYGDRVDRAYRFNHTKEVVDLVSKYIFKAKISRNEEDAPEQISKFWTRATKRSSSIKKFIRSIEKESSIYGRIWVVIDNNKVGLQSSDEETDDNGTKRDDELNDTREYGYTVKPQHVLDMSYGDDGHLNWILIMETRRDDEDPFAASGDETKVYRLWTRDDWYLIEATDDGGKIGDSGSHKLGIVPIFSVDHNDSDELYSSPSLIGDISYLDRAVANYLSNLDAIIQDQSFSQLAMPAQGILPGESAYKKLVEMGTKRIFLFDGEHGGQPFYLSPDPRQAELIITVVTKIINEIYHSVGMAGERTKQDNAVGIDNSSGVAKAYDFERVNALLTSKAASLQRAEVKMMELVMKWHGEDADLDYLNSLVTYPETFDIRGLSDEFDIANQLMLISAPTEMKKEQMRALVDKLFPRIKKELKVKMIAEIDEMSDELLMPESSLIPQDDDISEDKNDDADDSASDK